MLTTALDLIGAGLIIAAAFFVAPALSLLVAGGFALLASWRLANK